MDVELKQQAACRGKTDLFFTAVPRTVVVLAKEREALKLCSTCPIQRQCLDWGLKHELHGIWGGTTERARDRMRKKFNIKYVPAGGLR